MCGKPREETLPISVGRQVFMYLVSFFLAPVGLWWGIRYLKASDSKRRTIGIIIVCLTAGAILLMILGIAAVMGEYSKILNNLGTGSYQGF